MTTRKAARPNMNPRVTLRAKTVPNKKRVASKQACRKATSFRSLRAASEVY